MQDELATLSLGFQRKGSQPIYLQLAGQIRQMIEDGRLSEGDRLPSSRKLADELDISRTSALSAYDQLTAEGWLISRPAAGVFVNAARSSVKQTHESEALLTESVARRQPSVEASDLFDSGPDIEQFPFNDWARCLSRVWRKPDSGLLRDRHPGGYWPLRQAICRYLNIMRDVQCIPEQVIVTAGNRDALSLISTVLLQPGDSVWLEDPGYPPLRQGLNAAGAAAVFCGIDEEGMTLPATPTQARFAWMTPTRQYPLGTWMSTQRRLDWLQLSRKQKFWLVEDDYDSEFHYRKSAAVPLFNLDHQQRVILVGSFSKVMFRTLRIGYLVAPPVLVEPLLQAQDRLGTLASMPVQPALAEFIGHRRFASHLRRMRGCYQQRRDYLHGLLNPRLSNYLDVELPDRGMHLLVRLRPSVLVSDCWLEQQLEKQNIQASALSRHCHQVKQQGLILGFSGSSEERLREGVEVLQKLLTTTCS